MANYHTVEQGECLASIAKKYGLSDYCVIYNHANNTEFKKSRPNPNIIYPGDRLFIPAKELREESCSTEQRHKFKLKASRVLLRIVLKDDQDLPYANKKYKLKVGEKEYDGTTNGQGLAEQKIPADAESGELRLWTEDKSKGEFHAWKFALGHLDPVESITGVQARLNNMGFYCGAVDDVLGPKTAAALRAFQTQVGLTETGQADAATRRRLGDKHDVTS